MSDETVNPAGDVLLQINDAPRPGMAHAEATPGEGVERDATQLTRDVGRVQQQPDKP